MDKVSPSLAFVITLACVLCLHPMPAAHAESPFDGVELVGDPGTYVITKSTVNVRARPHPQGRKINSVKRGTIVTVPGRADNTSWYAIQLNEEDLGFVFQGGLTPLLDGSSEAPITGEVPTAIGTCRYEGTFHSRNMDAEELYSSSDYFFRVNCDQDDAPFGFVSAVFISEIPFNLGHRSVFQISMDFQDISTDYEEFLSIISVYNASEKTVRLDKATLKGFASLSEKTTKSSPGVRQALDQAVRLSLGAISEKGWASLRKGAGDA